MPERNVIGNAATHLSEMMNRSVKAAASLMPGPPGTEPRSRRSIDSVWERIVSLPREEKQAMLVAMAERAGHRPDEETPCELCRLIAMKARGVGF